MAEATTRSSNHSKEWLDGYTNWDADGVPQQDTVGNQVHSWTDYVTGQKNPQWKTQVQRGINATTPLEGEKHILQSNQGFVQAEFYLKDTFNYRDPPNTATRRQWIHDPLPTLSDPSTLSIVSANNAAKLKFLKKLQATQQTLQGSIALAEGYQTLKLLMNPLKALRGGVRQFIEQRKAARRSLRNLPRKRKRELLADAWLEAQFGWKPLINDIDDAAKALANHVTDGYIEKWAPLYASAEDILVSEKGPKRLGVTVPWMEGEYVRKDRAVVIYRGQADARSHRVGPGNLERVGLSSADLAPALWEVIPWSFMIDYFSNAGDIIEAYSWGRKGLRWSSKTVIQERSYEFYGNRMEPFPSATLDVVMSEIQPHRTIYKRRIVSRDQYSGSFTPSLEFSIPGLGTKWLNIAALYVGRRDLNSIYLT